MALTRAQTFIRLAKMKRLADDTLRTFHEWLYESPFWLGSVGRLTGDMKRLLGGVGRLLGQTDKANRLAWRTTVNDTPWILTVPRPRQILIQWPWEYPGFDQWKAHSREPEHIIISDQPGVTLHIQRLFNI